MREAPADQAASVLQRLYRGLGRDAARALVPEIVERRGDGIALYVVGDEARLARDIVRGGRLLREKPELASRLEDRRAAMAGYLGAGTPGGLTAEQAAALAPIREAATALYATRRDAAPGTDFDADLFKAALSDVVEAVVAASEGPPPAPLPGLKPRAFDRALTALHELGFGRADTVTDMVAGGEARTELLGADDDQAVEAAVEPGKDFRGGLPVLGRALLATPHEMFGATASALRAGEGLEEESLLNELIRSSERLAAAAMKERGAKDENTVFLSLPPIGDITYRHLRELPQNLGFSLTAAAAGLGVGVPIALAPVPGARPAAWAAGTGATGVMAYRMAKDQIVSDVRDVLNQHSLETTGAPISDADWRQIRDDIEGAATRYGLWESIPEALGQATGLKIIRMPIGQFMKLPGMRNVFSRAVAKFAGIMGVEQATETVTGYGQGAIEAELGLRERAPIVAEAFKEQAPQTLLVTTIMGAAGAAGSTIYSKTADRIRPPLGGPASDSSIGGPVGRGLSTDDVQGVVARITARWDNDLAIEIASGFEGLPREIQENAAAPGSDTSGITGLYHDGTAYLIAGNIANIEEAELTLFHEAYGHYGIERLFGQDTWRRLSRLYDELGGDLGLRKLEAKHRINLEPYREALAEASPDIRRTVLAAEMLALLAEDQRPSIRRRVKEIGGVIRDWLRVNGFASLAKYNDTDLFYMLRRSRKVVQRGGPRSGVEGRSATRASDVEERPNASRRPATGAIPSRPTPISAYAKEAMDHPGDTSLPPRPLGPVTEAEISKVKAETGIDLSGYRREVTSNSVRHIINTHGDPAIEKARKPPHRAVTFDDFDRIPEIVASPNQVKLSDKKSRGLDVIIYKKRINGVVFYLEEVRTGRRTVVPKTMYIQIVAPGEMP